MSKINCLCGHVIVDQTDNLAYKAIFVRHQDLEQIDNWTKDIANFIISVKIGKRKEWLNEYFNSDIYDNISDESVVFDIMAKNTFNYESIIYQCEKCGRVLIQKGNQNEYLSFYPEDDNWVDLFKGNTR